MAAMKIFKTEARYGPIFSCSICFQHFFKTGVVRLSQLSHLEDLNNMVNLHYTKFTMPHQFKQLDSQWICKDCKDEVAKGRTPCMAGENGLAPTWLPLPELTQEEHEVLAELHPVVTLSGLRGSREGNTTTLVIPSSGSPNHSSLNNFLDSIHCQISPYVLRRQVLQSILVLSYMCPLTI